MLHGCAIIAKQVLLLGCGVGVIGGGGVVRCLLVSVNIQHIQYAPKVRNCACIQTRLGSPEARRRRLVATRLPFGMRTEVEVEMAALRPGSEGLLMSICLSVSVHSAPGTELSC